MGFSLMIKQGNTYNKWTVIGETPDNAKSEARWMCRCSCGAESLVRARSLVSGRSKSCGRCLTQVPKVKKQALPLSDGTHIRTFPEYQVWQGVRRRCYDTKYLSYSRYGGRGIKVCQRWLDSYENFLNDMGRRPTPAHSIDRIDLNGDYEPSNCRWATVIEQNRNKSNVVFTEETIRAIYQKRAEGASLRVLARDFKVAPAVISRIVNGQNWRDIYEMEAYKIYGQGLDSLLETVRKEGYDKGFKDGQEAAARALGIPEASE